MASSATASASAARPEGGERRDQVRAVAGPERGISCQHLRDERVEVFRHVRHERADPRDLAEQELAEHGHGAVALERRGAGQIVEEHAAEREHVGARIDQAVVARLLGRHVAGGAEQRAGPGELGAALALGDAEVEDLDLIDVAAGEEQVAGLEIAVDDAAGMRHGERFGDTGSELDGVARGEARA
jgi:hypothetical protein